MDRHADKSARDDREKAFLRKKDSKNCGGAVGALRIMVKVSDLGDRAFAIMRNTAALPTQS